MVDGPARADHRPDDRTLVVHRCQPARGCPNQGQRSPTEPGRRDSSHRRPPPHPVQLVIRDAATADPDARAVWAELQAERLAGMTIFATALRDRGHLRSDLTIDHARDTLWTYNSAELYQLLVIERGWTPEHDGRWLAAALL